MTHEIATLAPNAGAGIGKLLFDELLKDETFLPRMVAAIDAGLNACFPKRWDQKTEDWCPAEPDGKTRVHTVLSLLAQAEGEPVKRIIHQHLGAGGTADPLAALRESPELLAAVERTLEKAKWRTSGQQAHKRPGARAAKTVAAIVVDE